MAWMMPAATVGSALIGGLFEEDAPEPKQQRFAYPGQKSIAKALTPYLWESLGTGLTEREKRLYRGEGRTSILQAVKAAQKQAGGTYAAQGLRGGRIADILSGIGEAGISELGKLETDIMSKDIEIKRKRLSDILNYLALSAGEGYPPDLGELRSSKFHTAGKYKEKRGGGGDDESFLDKVISTVSFGLF